MKVLTRRSQMKKKKYYVVVRGRVRGIFLSWDDCKASVTAYPKASYKSFEGAQEALDYLLDALDKEDSQYCKGENQEGSDTIIRSKINNFELKNTEDKRVKDYEIEEKIHLNMDKNQYIEKNDEKDPIFGTIEAYIDGSYEHASKTYGSGLVVLKDGEVIDMISNTGQNPNFVSMRNVAGEIEASMLAMKYCIDKGYKDLLIYYDYEGIEKWCSGEWKANKEGTIYYRQFCIEAMKKINISFKKVKAHSGNKYNDMADKLAKQAVFI